MPRNEEAAALPMRNRNRINLLLRVWVCVALAFGVAASGMISPVSASPSFMQSTPEEEEEAETPESEEETPSQSAGPEADMSLTAGFPVALSQGAVYTGGADQVWVVTEVTAPELADAEVESGGAAIILQRTGASIVWNQVTGKRTRLEPGEAWFRASSDGYRISADSSNSVYWVIQLVDVDTASSLSAFYEGSLITGLDETTYDLESVRYVLQPGDTVDLPAHVGTGMIMNLSGEIEIRMQGSGAASLSNPGEGQSLKPEVTQTSVSNPGAEPAMFLYTYLASEISDETAGSGTAGQQTNQGSDSGTEPDETPDTSGQTPPETTETDTSQSGSTNDNGEFVSTISIYAEVDIYIQVTADGTVVYDGTLFAGQSTGPIAGHYFEVYTSSGVSTWFTNACGTEFQMGTEQGEITYGLTADPSICDQ